MTKYLGVEELINLPTKIEGPLNRDTLNSINQKHIQRPFGQNNIKNLNNNTNKSEVSQNRVNDYAAANRAAPPPNCIPAIAPAQDMRHSMVIPNLINTVRKGQKTALETSGGLNHVKVCMGWNVNNPACEVDVSAFLLSKGMVPGDAWFIFYGQEASPDGSTNFRTDASPDRQSISINFPKLNPVIDKILFTLTIDDALEKKLNFSMIKDAYIRLVDILTNRELVSFKIDEYYSNVTSMMIGEIYKHNGAWKFNAIGNGVNKDLAGLCQMYGVQVE